MDFDSPVYRTLDIDIAVPHRHCRIVYDSPVTFPLITSPRIMMKISQPHLYLGNDNRLARLPIAYLAQLFQTWASSFNTKQMQHDATNIEDVRQHGHVKVSVGHIDNVHDLVYSGLLSGVI